MALRPSAALSFRSTTPQFLKLFALPLTRPKPASTSGAAATAPAFLLHAKRTPAAEISLKNDDGSKDLPYITRATVWAADNWLKLGQANEGTWKRKAYVLGDRFMDRIEFEEWALKAIDPALSPKPWTALTHGSEGVKTRGEDAEKVELLYPESLLSPEELVESLKKQLEHREPHHRAAMIKCLAGAPLTIPFAIVPIVPNFPLFYVLWRAWSHFRAWKASQYLQSLLSAEQLSLTASQQLDTIYSATKHSSAPDQLLLTKEKVPKLVQAFGLSGEEAGELRRVVVQSEQRLKQVLGERKVEEASGEQVKEAVESQSEVGKKQ